MEKNKKNEIDTLEAISMLAIDYMRSYGNPNAKMVVTEDRLEILSIDKGIPLPLNKK